MEKVDFVVLWVDGNDLEWQSEREKYKPSKNDLGSSINRFRDWDLMRYWFRGVEKFAPWVNNVYFVTCGHYPQWLNIDHPKLKLVKHSDYIPQLCLPTFNSNVIELYLHKIESLSEYFVLFNDDMFLTSSVSVCDFFQNGLPRETVRFGLAQSAAEQDVLPHIVLNNSAIINAHFSKREVQRKYWCKLYSLKYGKDLIRNLLLTPFKFFSSFYDTHVASSHLKSTFFEVWEAEPEILSRCGTHRFRTAEDVNHWLMKWWRYCKGEFVPRSINWGKCFEIGQDSGVVEAIRNQKHKSICLNDSDPNLDFERHQKELIEAFEAILPDKCSFEK